jgi:hypothetical protein
MRLPDKCFVWHWLDQTKIARHFGNIDPNEIQSQSQLEWLRHTFCLFERYIMRRGCNIPPNVTRGREFAVGVTVGTFAQGAKTVRGFHKRANLA